MLRPTAETIRVELARHRITKITLARRVGMTPSQLSAYLTGQRPMYSWAAHNLGFGINILTGHMIFDVNMSLPLQSGVPGRSSRQPIQLDLGPHN